MRDISAVLAAGSGMVTRIGWRALKPLDASGQTLDRMAVPPQDDARRAQNPRVAGVVAPLRFAIRRLPPTPAARQETSAGRRANHNGHHLDPRIGREAGQLILPVSLSGQGACQNDQPSREPDA